MKEKIKLDKETLEFLAALDREIEKEEEDVFVLENLRMDRMQAYWARNEEKEEKDKNKEGQ